ncbi:putative ribonuclease H-like domain-containing protein [Tanacetum coccineum]|uniref:Ribonuclease H-like domain-containing protein n=1 Tax=Tanacetum coccineum TaxID=301880 RepID=A0ABQ4ZTP6_9ASTR
MTHSHPNRGFVPQVVLTRTGKINIAGAKVNTAVRPVNIVGSKPTVNHPRPISDAYKNGYSQVTRSVNKFSANKNSIFNKKVNTVRVKDITARDRAVVSENKGKGENVVKALACWGNPQQKEYKEKVVIDSGYSRHMTGNKCYLDEYEDHDGGFVSFGDGKGRISGKGKIKTGSLDFDDVYFCKELKRLRHINFKTMNKLVKENLVKGLPSKIFENDYSCVACQKGKQHKASYKTKLVNSISKPLHMLHMDLFGPTNVKSLMKKSYCLVVTDDFSRFSWLFFFATKDETSGILKSFITKIENQLDHKVKVIRCDDRTKFQNSKMNQFCEMKGIKREVSVARTPQQNGVAERKNRTLIEVVRTRDHLGNLMEKLMRDILLGPKDSEGDTGMKPSEVDERGASDKNKKDAQDTRSDSERLNQSEMQTEHTNSTNSINTISTPVSTTRPTFDNVVPSPLVNTDGPSVSTANAFKEHLFERFSPFKNAFTLPPILNVSSMDNTGIFGNAYNDEDLEE